MEWTKEKPTVEGWYWVAHRGWEPQVAEVKICKGKGLVWLSGYEVELDLYETDDCEGDWWMGPLAKPELPK